MKDTIIRGGHYVFEPDGTMKYVIDQPKYVELQIVKGHRVVLADTNSRPFVVGRNARMVDLYNPDRSTLLFQPADGIPFLHH